MRDALGPIYTNPDFADLFPKDGAPAQVPAHLALITVMQFAENLSDRQAADALRARIDWKYALALELTDPGFDASVFCDFRARLIAGGAEQRLFEQMLLLVKDQGLLKAKGRQRTDATHVLAAIHVLNRLECIGETLRHALNTLATSAPAWLTSWVPAEWYDRYGRRIDEYRLPDAKAARYALAEAWGADGRALLHRLWDPATCPQGQVSRSWKAGQDHEGRPSVASRFDKATCAACPERTPWMGTAKEPRSLLVHERALSEGLHTARTRQQTETFKAVYADRAGIEGSIWQAVRVSGMRQSRYIGYLKTRLMHFLVAAALNFRRVAAWLAEVPQARTRTSAFARLAPFAT